MIHKKRKPHERQFVRFLRLVQKASSHGIFLSNLNLCINYKGKDRVTQAI